MIVAHAWAEAYQKVSPDVAVAVTWGGLEADPKKVFVKTSNIEVIHFSDSIINYKEVNVS